MTISKRERKKQERLLRQLEEYYQAEIREIYTDTFIDLSNSAKEEYKDLPLFTTCATKSEIGG